MIRDDDIERIMKRMIQDIFGLSDEEVERLEFKQVNHSIGPLFHFPMQAQSQIDEVDLPEPLVELHNNDDHYSVIIEASGYSEEQLFINIRKEEEKLNLIFGIQDINGRMHLKRILLPEDATEKFERFHRGPVIELIIQKAK